MFDYGRGSFLKRVALSFLEIIFPRFCVTCSREGHYICEECALFISDNIPFCPSCGRASYFGKKHKRCKGNLDGIIALWDNDGVIKKAIEIIKERGVFTIVDELIGFFVFTIENDQERFSSFLKFLLDEETVIIPIPKDSRRNAKRGFDLSSLIADKIAFLADKKKKSFLKRVKATQSQSNLNKRERVDNIKGAFVFSQTKIKKVVLIDDLWSSGSTMNECARLLKENGVKEVWGFVLTRDRNC
ncbi:MAG: phosphoribosyltransferase family protein [Minisyncoccales bacterium]|jgi:ComF family protein